jgi:NAD(P)-dependent dehydrogenase (short-subunit alcohol dehydrogenase family)
MDLGLTGKRALVVGGSGFIGQAVAARLLDEGAAVVLAARDGDRLARAVDGLAPHGKAASVRLDTRDEATVASGVGSAVEILGGLDILVNTGAPSARAVMAGDPNDPATVLDAFEGKAIGYLRSCLAVLPRLRDQAWGRIVNISGANAFLTASLIGSVRNVAVATVTKNLADQLYGTGVTVNVIHPGIVDAQTPMPGSEAYAPARQGRTSADEVAALTTYLCSEQASTISGVAITIGHESPGIIRY